MHLSGFLSCLYGNELVWPVLPVRLSFLSCLYGSERKAFSAGVSATFLSCLYGSEPGPGALIHPVFFKLPVRQ